MSDDGDYIAAVYSPDEDVPQLFRVTSDGRLTIENLDDPASDFEPAPPSEQQFADSNEALVAMALWILHGEEEGTMARVLDEIQRQAQELADSGLNAPIPRARTRITDGQNRAQTIEELIRRFKQRR